MFLSLSNQAILRAVVAAISLQKQRAAVWSQLQPVHKLHPMTLRECGYVWYIGYFSALTVCVLVLTVSCVLAHRFRDQQRSHSETPAFQPPAPDPESQPTEIT
ncbi:hypothetical protein J4Q44_G00253730 [Coregonus suidteri]|uniref:Uncharacterized protein n=1 Tax=Coregonus suidteri TaxID=861788 RepID=A0AAN8L458_9TELE